LSVLEQNFLNLSCKADASAANWNEVRASLVAEVLRRPADSSSPRRLYGEVHGESMLPTLWPGDVVAIEPCIANDLRVGEIVLASWNKHLVLHRLIAPYSREGFRLRGDCVAASDPIYPADALLGKVIGVMQGSRTTSKFFLHPGIGAAAAKNIGLALCHWDVARRATLRLRQRLIAGRKTNFAPLPADFVVRGAR
jgi:hypothetical protein